MNTDEHVKDQLVAYLSGNLDERGTAIIAEHLNGCDACSRELESNRKVWLSLGNIPDEQPAARMTERFRESLIDYEATLRGSHPKGAHLPSTPSRGWLDWISPRQPAVQFALVLILFAVGGIVGGLVGYRLGGNSPDVTGMVQLREEVRSVNRLLIVSLLGQQSATERLMGVSRSYKLEQADPEVTGALLRTLTQDPNVNVRLAALEAVSRNISQPGVREELLRSLTDISSPMVQLAIVDFVVHSNMKESAGVLADLLKKPGINEVVKTRIEQALQYLNI